MAVGMTHMGAVNDMIRHDPLGALSVAEQLLVAGGVTLGGIATALGIKGHFTKAQRREVEMLDELAAAEFPRIFEYTVGNVAHGIRTRGAFARLRWHPGHFKTAYSKGISDITTPVDIDGELVDDRAVILGAAGARGVPDV